MSHSAVLTQRSRVARVVVADDHDLARAGLRGLLSGERGLEVVGEAATGREALELCRRVRPDLVLMDVRMPDMNGLAVTRAIKQESPSTSVILFTMYESADYLVEALKAGADYIQIDEPAVSTRMDELDLAIVVAYGRIIPEWMLNLPRLGNINLHASLLPKYRGAAPIQWAVANGETVTGATYDSGAYEAALDIIFSQFCIGK